MKNLEAFLDVLKKLAILALVITVLLLLLYIAFYLFLVAIVGIVLLVIYIKWKGKHYWWEHHGKKTMDGKYTVVKDDGRE